MLLREFRASVFGRGGPTTTTTTSTSTSTSTTTTTTTRTRAHGRPGVFHGFQTERNSRFDNPYGVFGCHEKWNVQNMVRLGS